MESIVIWLSTVLLVSALLMLRRRQRAAARSQRETYLARLEEVARTAEFTKRACFTSIERLHGRLETLQGRASSAEQRLSSFVEPPELQRKEQYHAAALLLAGGNSVERVAAMLALPASQVELVQELQTFVVPHKAPLISEKTHQAAKAVRRRARKKPARHDPRHRVRPILLTDVVRFDGAAAAKAEAAA